MPVYINFGLLSSAESKGGFSLPSNRNFSADELKLLLEYDEDLIKSASSQILSGEIKLNPYRYGKGTSALTYSDYRDVFFFDSMQMLFAICTASKLNKINTTKLLILIRKNY